MARILDSRRQGTRLLAEAIAKLERKPKAFLSASAVGYYGDRGDDPVDEQDRTAGTGFLAEVCQAWELASRPAAEAGISLRCWNSGMGGSSCGRAHHATRAWRRAARGAPPARFHEDLTNA